MKRLILDDFRRKWAVLAFAVVLQFVFGWLRASGSFSTSLAVSDLHLELLVGLFFIPLDLKLGISRVLATLPLTSKEVGRGLWLVSVGFPAIVLGSVLFLAEEAYCLMHPETVFATKRLLLLSFCTLISLGTAFTVLSNATYRRQGSARAYLRNVFLGLATAVIPGAGLILLGVVAKSNYLLAGFMGLGMVLTALGWFQAEQFFKGRTSLPESASPDQKTCNQPPHCPSRSHGGLRYLVSFACVRLFLFGVAVFILNILIMGFMKPWKEALKSVGTEAPFGAYFLMLFQILIVVSQMRVLRTLPISTTRLATVMLVTTLVPTIALGAVMAGVVGTCVGLQEAIATLKNFSHPIAPAALYMVFMLWKGFKGQWIFLLLIIGQAVPSLFPKPYQISYEQGAVIYGIIIVIAFMLSRRLIQRSSQVYKTANWTAAYKS